MNSWHMVQPVVRVQDPIGTGKSDSNANASLNLAASAAPCYLHASRELRTAEYLNNSPP